jgi:tRNA(fMet)-specific endonuclease VapC
MFALDTNTVVYFFKDKRGVAERLLATPPQEVAIPAIVVYELEVGIAKSSSPERRQRQLRDLIAHTTILPFDRSVAAFAGQIRADLEAEGRTIGPSDHLIAGTVLACGATLVPRNVREFTRIPGLQVEDWS